MRFEIELALKEQGTKISQLESDLKKLSSTATNTQGSLDKFSNSIKGMTGALAAYISVSKGLEIGAAIAGSIIANASAFEKYNTQLKVMLGGQAAATAAFSEIKEFAATTPFELDKVVQAMIKMNAYGMGGGIDALRVYGDAASGLGRDVIDVVEAIADASRGSNERINELGFITSKTGEKVSYTFAGITKTIDKTGLSAYASGKLMKEAVEGLLKTNFNGLMEEQSQTFEGQLSNLKDKWTVFSVEIAEKSGLFDNFKVAISEASEIFKSFTGGSEQDIKDFGDTVRSFITMFIDGTVLIVKGLTYFAMGIESIEWIFKSFYRGVVYVLSGIKQAITAVIASAILASLEMVSLIPGMEQKMIAQAMIVKKNYRAMNAESEKFQSDTAKDMDNHNNKFFNSVNNKVRGLEMLTTAAKRFSDVFAEDRRPSKGKEKKYNTPQTEEEKRLAGERQAALDKQLKAAAEAAKKRKKDKESEMSDMVDYLTMIGKIVDAQKLSLEIDIKSKVAKGNLSKKEVENYRAAGLAKISKVAQDLIDEETKKRATEQKDIKQKSIENLALYSDYYKQIGDMEAYKAVESAKIQAEVDLLPLLPQEKVDLGKARVDEFIKKIDELKKVDFSNSTMIEYFDMIGDKAQSATFKLAESLAKLTQDKSFTGEQAADYWEKGTAKIKKEGDDDLDEANKKAAKEAQDTTDKRLKSELDYYSGTKKMAEAQAKELEIYDESMKESKLTKIQLEELHGVKVDELNEKYKKLAQTELESQTTFAAGFEVYMNKLEERIKNYSALSQTLMSSFEGTLQTTFTSFFDYTSKGFLDLKTLAGGVLKGVLEGISQMITQMIVLQTMQAAFGGGGGSSAAGFISSLFANGAAFNGGNVQAFATGTVISSPTYFPMGGNKTGLMGEAGPEAIMPLSRGRDGKLGVATSGGSQAQAPVINVHNYGNSQVSTKVNNKGEVDITLVEQIDKQLAARYNSGKSQTDKVMAKKYAINKR